jgi:hypothetical protein
MTKNFHDGEEGAQVDESDGEDEMEIFPQTLSEATDVCFHAILLTESDFEVIKQCPPEKLDWLHSNFERQIQSLSGLSKNNFVLIQSCCPDTSNATAHDASRVIMEALRVYFQTGQPPQFN